jgi:hypothetical protein
MSCVSWVGSVIMTLMLDEGEQTSIPGRRRYCSFFHRFHVDPATHPASVSTWVNRPGLEAYHWPPSRIKVAWISSPPSIFLGRCLTKHRGSLAYIVVAVICAVQICLSLSLPAVSISLDNYWGQEGLRFQSDPELQLSTKDSCTDSQYTLWELCSARLLIGKHVSELWTVHGYSDNRSWRGYSYSKQEI